MTRAPSSSDATENGASPPPPRLVAAWERAAAPAGVPFAVEITFTAPHLEPDSAPRLPLNVGLALDRSGSMSGAKLAAAREAAIGLAGGLEDGERLGCAAFDSNVVDVCRSTPLDETARAAIRGCVSALEPGGSTALFAGFARAAELVATGGAPEEFESWVIVLSDGKGNQGLVAPAAMRAHAAALCERGIRTIAIGIGDDYRADQLAALADGGGGEFHHAARPSEIVEIVLGELRELRATAANDLRIAVEVQGATRWLALGGEATQEGSFGAARFDRVRSGGIARAVALVWPASDEVSVRGLARWQTPDGRSAEIDIGRTSANGPAARDVALAARAAGLWHAHIVARSLELNDRGAYDEAERTARDGRAALASYAGGLPGVAEMLDTLDRIAGRVVRAWRTAGRREAYSLSRKLARGKEDFRADAPLTVREALERDNRDRRGNG
jgi:Ca-activated chloride channel family protein